MIGYGDLVRDDNELYGGVAALTTAIQRSSLIRVKSIVEEFKKNGAIKIKELLNTSCGPMKVLPLQLAANLSDQTSSIQIVRFLLKNGAKLPYPECWGRTPLHQAVKFGQVPCVQVLLDRGADVNASDEKGSRPLLLAGAGITAEDTFAITRYEKIIEMLVAKGANVNVVNNDTECSALHHAVLLRSETATRILLTAGASLKHQELLGDTVLHVAAAGGNIDVLKLLLKYKDGKDLINVHDKVGNTPLHKAAFAGHQGCLKMLINSGGNLAAFTDAGLTVVDVIFSYIPRPVDFFVKIFDSKIIANNISVNDRGFKIKLDFDVLAPENVEWQTAVVSLLSYEAKIIQHPLVETFILSKWRKIRGIFVIFFVMFLCYVLTMSSYSFILARLGSIEDSFLIMVKWWSFWPLCISSVTLLTHSTLELMLLGTMRFTQIEPWLNFFCSLYSVILILIAHPTSSSKTSNEESPVLQKNITNNQTSNSPIDAGNLQIDTTLHIASIVVLVSWGRLMFLLARFPTCGYYGLMFLAVFTNVLKVMMTFICLVIGFVVFFCIQFPNDEQFANPWVSLVKTVVMMTGEFEYSDLFTKTNAKKTGHQPGIAVEIPRFVFLLFILLSTIVLMNLMVGLAVSDIQDLQIEGHVKRLTKQVNFIYHFEKLTSHPILNKLKIGRMVNKKHQLPNKLIIEASAVNPNDANRFPYTLLEAIISVALRNRKFKATAARHSHRKETAEPISSGQSFLEVPTHSTKDLVAQTSKDRESAAGDLYTNIQELRQMMQFIVSQYQNQNRDHDNGRPDTGSGSFDDEDDDDYDESAEEVGSKVTALLRKMSQKKRRQSDGYVSFPHQRLRSRRLSSFPL